MPTRGHGWSIGGQARIRTIAATSAFLITAGLLAPAFAQADASPATTLYVNNKINSNCSGAAGLGTVTTPYCTIQAAANAAERERSRRRVHHKAAITLASGAGFAVNGAQYVTIQDFAISSSADTISGSVAIANSSNITINGLTASGNEVSIDSSASSDVTIERNQVVSAIAGTNIDVSGGGSGNVVTGGCTGISAVPGQGDALNNITFENNIVANMSTNAICAGGTAISNDAVQQLCYSKPQVCYRGRRPCSRTRSRANVSSVTGVQKIHLRGWGRSGGSSQPKQGFERL